MYIELNRDEKIQMCMDQAGAISFQQGMLNYSLDELVKMAQTQSNVFEEKILCRLKMANKRLKAIIEEKKVTTHPLELEG